MMQANFNANHDGEILQMLKYKMNRENINGRRKKYREK